MCNILVAPAQDWRGLCFVSLIERRHTGVHSVNKVGHQIIL